MYAIIQTQFTGIAGQAHQPISGRYPCPMPETMPAILFILPLHQNAWRTFRIEIVAANLHLLVAWRCLSRDRVCLGRRRIGVGGRMDLWIRRRFDFRLDLGLDFRLDLGLNFRFDFGLNFRFDLSDLWSLLRLVEVRNG